jgi:CBS domain-containing protein
MTCKDIMTPNPLCCLPSDSVAIAAQIMRRNDVGPVLVVSDHTQNRLLGIVTDRDLALKVIADGRDPHITRVDEVMTLNPVSCREEESSDHAVGLMAKHQVRRIPVVNSEGRLTGIVAQADVARHEDEKQVGRVVEQISEPYPSSGWVGQRTWKGVRSGGAVALGALCMGLGAGLMYALSPTRRDNLASGSSETDQSEAQPAQASTSEVEQVPDHKLVTRIRSRIWSGISRPKAIQITCRGGHVTLGGPVLANEVRQLLDYVTAVPGVRSVQSRLEVCETREAFEEAVGARSNRWRPTSRFLAGIAGSGALLYGMRPKARVAATRRDAPGF